MEIIGRWEIGKQSEREREKKKVKCILRPTVRKKKRRNQMILE